MNYRLLDQLRKKLKNNKPVLGTWLQSGCCTNAEILANNKFDWIAIDLEHGQIDWKSHENLVRTIEACDVVPITRISKPAIDDVKHALDSGSYGVIIPSMKNSKECENLIHNSFLPPKGIRGVGFCRANKFGKEFDKYIKTFKPLIIPMLENLDFFKNLDKIKKLDGIDAIFLGPYDFSASIKKTGKFQDKEFIAYEKKFLKNLKNHKIKTGIHVVTPYHADVKKMILKGFRFIALSTDTQFLRNASNIDFKI
jgi:2-dehydro-3-deoxyglucarate aldolase